VLARAGDDHRLGLAVHAAADRGVEVIDDDADLGLDGMVVELDHAFEQTLGLTLFEVGIVLDGLEQPPVGAIGRIVFEDVHDELLLDRLAHGVEAEGGEGAVEGLGLGRRGEGEHADVGHRSAGAHFGLDPVLHGFGHGAFGARGFLEGGPGQYLLDALGAFARLRGVGFVDDDGEAPVGHGADVFVDHRELLEGGDDDLLAVVDGLGELAGAFGDVFDEAAFLFEVLDRLLELAVEDLAVGDDDDGVEHRLVVVVVERGQAVGEPSDGIGLAAAGGVLDEVALSGAVLAGMGDHSADRVALVIAREDELRDLLLASFVVDLVFLDDVDEPLDELEDAVFGPHVAPHVGNREADCRGWVAGAAVVSAVERQEGGPGTFEAGGEVDQVGVHGEVCQAAFEGEERFFGVAVVPVLGDRVPHGGRRDLELDGEEW